MLRPPPQLTVSAWAEQHRILGSRASSEPGPWRTSRTPYLRDVMDALSAVHPARRIVFMKGAQVGEQLHQVKDRRGFVRQEWAKLRERNEALDCAVLARAALWLLGADRYGERFWLRLREDIANAPVEMLEHPRPEPAPHADPPPLMRRPGWLAPRGGWLR